MPLNSLGREPFQPGQAPAAWPLLAGGGSPRPCSRALLQVDVDKDRSILLDWDRVRVFDREVAQMFLNMTRLEKEAQVGARLKKKRQVNVQQERVAQLGAALKEMKQGNF